MVASSISNVPVGGAAFSDFTIKYTDNVALNESTVGDDDIKVAACHASSQGPTERGGTIACNGIWEG